MHVRHEAPSVRVSAYALPSSPEVLAIGVDPRPPG
jgi:hypothetical protein